MSRNRRIAALNVKLKPLDFKLHSCFTIMITLPRLPRLGKRMFLLEMSKVLIGPFLKDSKLKNIIPSWIKIKIGPTTIKR